MDSHKIWCYQRVSTKEQKQTSLDVQYSTNLKHAKRIQKDHPDIEYEIVRLDEKLSGKDMEGRPKFMSMYENAEEGDIVLAYDVSRLGRKASESMLFAENLQERGIVIGTNGRLIDMSNPYDYMYFGFDSVAAQSQRMTTLKRSGESTDEKRIKGDYVFKSTLFGWDLIPGHGFTAPIVTINEEEAKLVRFAFQQYVSGLSMVKIAQELQRVAVVQHYWSESSLRRLFCNPIYMGMYPKKPLGGVSQAEQLKVNEKDFRENLVHSNLYEPIVSEELWWEAYHVYRDRSDHCRDFPFRYAGFECSSLLQCGECGSHAHHRQVKAKNNKYKKEVVYQHYEIRHHKKGCHAHIQPLKAYVVENIVKICSMIAFLDSDATKAYLEKKKSLLRNSVSEYQCEIDACDEQIKELDDTINNMVSSLGLLKNKDAQAKTTSKIDALSDDKDKIQSKREEWLQALRDESYEVDIAMHKMQESNVEEIVYSDASHRREIFLDVIESALVYDGRIELTYLTEKKFVIFLHERGKKIITQLPMVMYFQGKKELTGIINPTEGTLSFIPLRVPRNDNGVFIRYVNERYKEMADKINEYMSQCYTPSYLG